MYAQIIIDWYELKVRTQHIAPSEKQFSLSSEDLNISSNADRCSKKKCNMYHSQIATFPL